MTGSGDPPDPRGLVAHRAGNRPDTARSAIDRADWIESDVHVRRGRVEVRHSKKFWPTSRLWERWFLLPRDTEVFVIGDVLAAVGPDTPLLLDLKCYTGRAARRIRRAVSDAQPLIVSARSWWVLRQFEDRPGTTMLRSCRHRWHLELATRLPGLGRRTGIVAHQELLNPESIKAALAATPVLFTWAVPTVERAVELHECGVAGLIVDDLDRPWPRIDGPKR